MTKLTIILWVLNVLVDTIGQLSFKAAAQSGASYSGIAQWKFMLARPWIWIGLSSYVIEFVLWLAFLALVPLSTGVMLGSINVVAIMIAGRIWFKERLSNWRVAGCLLITIGVAVVGLG